VASTVRGSRDALGSILGLLTFLGGIALLLITFRLAYNLFQVPPVQAMQLTPGKPIDVSATGNSLVVLLFRILLLVVMGVLGSLIANRGISLYTQSRGLKVVEREQAGTVVEEVRE
jgi:hypothetical protein